ncbi:response regulator [Desulfurivibrio alkaliphilus]|uniref:Response regulator receiver modulated PilZ sensor protein n=1 Tax=Desulfurivibrio alkaliphilus (strain DSM 19089 / UNIQEM U267 / AHT2) TaxID=589865 RepID=D6Z437_DESAT|nr:response regulator [Desulfurivibrio alkaliphilus]ADH86312.1 response regulator receiver modulated PilZ sensor protein [Desulfurivibrio alkaliphilus AHT 2]
MNKVTFLVVDDSVTVRDLVRRSLKAIFGGAEVMLAEDGKAALRLLREKKIDIIISDWNMPNMNGEELLYTVRSDSELKEIPFVMMSTNSDRDFIIMAIQLGVTQYMVKPFTADELEKKIRSSLNVLCQRQAKRYALPAHVAEIHLKGKRIPGRLLDLSRTGAAFAGEKFDPNLGLFKPCELDLRLRDPDGLERDTVLISGLTGRIVRLEAEASFHPTSSAFKLALYLPPGNMERDVELRLTKLLKWLASKTPDVIGE